MATNINTPGPLFFHVGYRKMPGGGVLPFTDPNHAQIMEYLLKRAHTARLRGGDEYRVSSCVDDPKLNITGSLEPNDLVRELCDLAGRGAQIMRAVLNGLDKSRLAKELGPAYIRQGYSITEAPVTPDRFEVMPAKGWRNDIIIVIDSCEIDRNGVVKVYGYPREFPMADWANAQIRERLAARMLETIMPTQATLELPPS